MNEDSLVPTKPMHMDTPDRIKPLKEWLIMIKQGLE